VAQTPDPDAAAPADVAQTPQPDTADPTDQLLCVYKPASGERPLWDFPGMTLARHEVAAYEVSILLGLDVVPVTVWRDDLPQGPGAVQVWVPEEPTSDVEVFAAGEVPPDWLPVLSGDGAQGPVVVAHRDTARLADIAILDVVINNSDRKAGHLLGDGDAVRGIDHGVAFHSEWKLRTVLWGFAGRELSLRRIEALVKARDAIPDAQLQGVGMRERAAILARIDDLLAAGTYPLPRPGWPVVPWPLW